ncbi:MAG TPA: polyprenol monophosphomannose synthase [Thermogutta sp.]|nr:polyprenol monophosphomannose synthase [Thermogutta sp.]
MTEPSDVLVVVVTYNERETLPQLVEAVFNSAPQVDILVVDDNSPDGTGKWCEEYARQNPRMHCLQRPAKLGIGSAVAEGLRWAIDQGYRYVITMDADLSHPPEKIPELLAAIEGSNTTGADVVIGSRYVKGGTIQGWPWYRYLMSWGINSFSRWLLRLPVRDCSGNFRCYRASVLAALNWEEFCSTGYSFFEEILFRLRQEGATFQEIPIRFVERREGRSKMRLREALSAIAAIIRLALLGACSRLRGKAKPQHPR